MSDTPSWLSDDGPSDVAETLAKNPHVQNAAKKAAADPRVQQAMYDHAVSAATPAWASESNDTGHDGGGVYTNADGAEAQASGGKRLNPHSSNIASVPPEELEKMKGYQNILRLLFIGTAVFMAFVAVKTIISETDLFLLCFSFYIFLFAMLICCFEVQVFSFIAKFIAVNFGFMYNIVGRWLFLLFVGFMCYNLGDLGIACMSLLYVGGLGHAIIIFKFPFFQEYQRMLHYDLHKA